MKYKVEAQYTAYSQWDIDFDLEESYNWYIKYDTLEVQHKKMVSGFRMHQMLKVSAITNDLRKCIEQS